MPQLTKEAAQQVEGEAWDPNEGGSSFTVLEDGDYLFWLKEVSESDAPGPSGYHYWRWIFEHDEGSRVYVNSSLSPKARGKFGQIFAAFQVPADTPTEELIGQYVGMTVTKSPVTVGKNAGKGYFRNDEQAVWPAEEHDDYDPAVHGKRAAGGAAVATAADFGTEDAPEPVAPKSGRRKVKTPNDEEEF